MTRHQPKRPDRSQCSKRRSGFAMIICTVLLMAMTLMALSTIDVVGRDQTVAGYQSRKSMSLYAAEAGLAEVLRILAATGTPALTAGDLGDSTLFPYGQPSYSLDPTVADPIEDLGTMSPPEPSPAPARERGAVGSLFPRCSRSGPRATLFRDPRSGR